MHTWKREEIKADPVMSKLLKEILKIHKTPEHTARNLLHKQHIPDICELTTLYLVLPGENPGKTIYLCYDTSTWIRPEPTRIGFPTRVEAIIVFDDFVEYETDRVKRIGAADPDGRDASTLNLN